MAEALRVCVAGAGYFGQFHHQAWAEMDGVDFVGICSLSEEHCNEAADKWNVPGRYSDLDRMLDELKPDLLDIATPPPTHALFIRSAFTRGIPVICQKPFTTSVSEAEEMAALSEARGLALIVHENFRFQPWYSEIKKHLDAGLLGDLYQISFRMRPGDGQGADAYLNRQPYFQKMERFLIHETAIHVIDTFRYLFGEVEGVTARLAQVNPVIAGEDAGIVIFEFEGGRRGLFDGNRSVDHIAENRRLTMGDVRIEGSKGTLRLDGDARLFFRRHGENEENRIDYQWDNHGFGGNSVYALCRHVVQHLRDGTPAMNTAREYIKNLTLEEAVYQSHAEGRRIELG